MAVIKKEAYFRSSTGVNNIRCCIWQDEEASPVGIVQIAHGVAEHIERYDAFARFLCANGFLVCGNDHLGHGKSVNSMDDLGFFAEENGDVRMIDDMHMLYMIMHKRYPDAPYYLFGHSMGSFCARVYASEFGNDLDGVVFCGTGQLPEVSLLMVDPIKVLTQKLGTRAAIPGDMFALVNKIAVKNPRTQSDWLSRNAENVDAYINDPLCGFPLKMGGVRDLVSLAVKATSRECAENIPLGLPILMISGAKDPVGFNGKSVIDACEQLENLGHEPYVILYPGDRHEILNESDNEKVFNDILSWLNSLGI